MNGNMNGAFQEHELYRKIASNQTSHGKRFAMRSNAKWDNGHVSQSQPTGYKIEAMQDQKRETFDSAEKKIHQKLVRQKRKMSVQSKIKEYKDSFTVHGLTRSLPKDNKCEATFWTVVLLGGIALSAYIVQLNVRKFLSYEIYTHIQEKAPIRNYFPSVTFCEFNELKKLMFSYCGQRIPDEVEVDYPDICHYNQIPKFANATITNNKDFWTNGKFVVRQCDSLRHGSCLNSKYLKSSQLYNHSCITWNYNGDYRNLKANSIRFSFSFNQSVQSLNSPPTEIVAFHHESGILHVDLESHINIGIRKKTTMVFEKIVVKRLPHPYPSNCSYEKVNDIFPGKYARRQCIESNFFIQMYKKCGDTMDFMRKYIPSDIKAEYGRNMTMSQASLCIDDFVTDAEVKCFFPCEYQDIRVTHSSSEDLAPEKQDKTRYEVYFRHVNRYTHRVFEEKKLYSWQQMLSEVGGFIGLAIGASIISVFEIFTYLFLRVARMY